LNSMLAYLWFAQATHDQLGTAASFRDAVRYLARTDTPAQGARTLIISELHRSVVIVSADGSLVFPNGRDRPLLDSASTQGRHLGGAAGSGFGEHAASTGNGSHYLRRLDSLARTLLKEPGAWIAWRDLYHLAESYDDWFIASVSAFHLCLDRFSKAADQVYV